MGQPGRLDTIAPAPLRGPVIHVITGLHTGGAELMLAKLLRSARRQDHIVVSLGAGGEVAAQLEQAGVPVFPLRLRSVGGGLSGLPRLVRLIRNHRSALVQGWLAHGNMIATAAHALAGGKRPLLWSVRQSLSDVALEKWSTRRIIRLNARWSRRPTFILYNSQLGARQHQAIGYASDRGRIVPNGFDLDRFTPSDERREAVRHKLGVADHEILIGLIGRFHPTKNHRGFFQAASRVLAAEPRARFLCAGAGVSFGNSALADLVENSRLRDRLLLLGPCDDVVDLNRALDIACNVSVGEGFSNAVGEAMACGVPCVVTDSGDSRAIVGDTGLVCESRAPESIAAALLELIGAGEERRRELGRRARGRMEQEFSLEMMVRRYEDIYDEALGKAALT